MYKMQHNCVPVNKAGRYFKWAVSMQMLYVVYKSQYIDALVK